MTFDLPPEPPVFILRGASGLACPQERQGASKLLRVFWVLPSFRSKLYKITIPLHALTLGSAGKTKKCGKRKPTGSCQWNWSKEHQNAFAKLKDLLSQQRQFWHTLITRNFTFILHTDLSADRVGEGNQAYSRLSTTHGHITDCKLDSVVYAGVCV